MLRHWGQSEDQLAEDHPAFTHETRTELGLPVPSAQGEDRLQKTQRPAVQTPEENSVLHYPSG